MVAQHRRRRSHALVACLGGASSLAALLGLEQPASGMALCTLEPSILFAHPSLDVETTLPRNAELLFVVAGSIQHAALVWLPDGERSAPRATIPFDRYRIDARDRLTPGSHQAELGIAPLSGSRLVGPETYPLSRGRCARPRTGRLG